MAPRGKITRSTAAQINNLLDYMSNHTLFANNEFTGPLGAQRVEAEWASLKSILANYGPDKSVDQWKHTWRDLRKKARDDGGRVRLALNATGNSVPIPELSEKTKKILGIIGPECAIGIMGDNESGVGVAPRNLEAPSTSQGYAGSYEEPPTATGSYAEEVPSTSVTFEEPYDHPPEFLFEQVIGVEEVVSRAPRRSRALPPRSRARRMRTTHAVQPSVAFIAGQNDGNNILREISNTLRQREALDEQKYVMGMRQARRARGGSFRFF